MNIMKKKIVSKNKVFHESETGLRTICLFENITSYCEDNDSTFKTLLEYWSKDLYLDDKILKITIPKVNKSHSGVIEQQLNDMFKHRNEAVYKAYIIELESKDVINRCKQINLQFVGVYDIDNNMEVLFKHTSDVFNHAVVKYCCRFIRLFNNYANQIMG
jgi:hypothetical protein